MDFVFDLKVVADTPKSSPCRLLANLGEGIVSQVEIAFPPGCANKVFVVVRQGLHQVWPTNEDNAYHWDDRTYSFAENYPVKGGDPLFILEGWSPDTDFDHYIQFSFAVLLKEPLKAPSPLDKLRTAFGLMPPPIIGVKE